MIKRLVDLWVGLVLLVIFLLPMVIIAIIIRINSKGPALHWSKRIGRDNTLFLMPKFRSMTLDAPQVATHLFQGSQSYVTQVGRFLRATSLDEIPQVWSVVKGDMSLVGPRPALFNQDDLVALRTEFGIHVLRPGVTGWAQVNGRDELPVPVKVKFDLEYLQKKNLLFDLKILFLTFSKVLTAEGIKH